MNAKIIIRGKPVTKKNSSTIHWWRYHQGQKIPRDRPLVIWSDAYQAWGKQAVQQLVIFKKNWHDRNGKPFEILETPHFITFIFYVTDKRRRDLSNFYEAPQDVLAGDLGFKISTKIQKEDYQIFKDDNHTIIANHGGSRVFLDKANPRTEIYISPFSDAQWRKITNVAHPDLAFPESEAPVVLPTSQLKLSLKDML